MKFYSTNNRGNTVDLKQAVLKGLADDGGIYMPDQINNFSREFIENLGDFAGSPLSKLAFEISKVFFGDAIDLDELRVICDESINFESPLKNLDKQIKVLELFHGPTLAFKDFGARFLASLVKYFAKNLKQEVTVLVATSGDTGGAVANGFANTNGVKVILLYPSGKVSELQEKQLTTLGGNVYAIEVDGVFDDCQRMVKQAFLDQDLRNNMFLTSANSINIGRLIAQVFYYFSAYAQMKASFGRKFEEVIFSVPSGNFGNLTAGLIAKKMGLPVAKFIAATNVNDTFPKFMETGLFEAKPSIKTISNAMDVGNPNNFPRIMDLYSGDIEKLRKNVWSKSYSDDETSGAIREIFEKYGYVMDPHGAVAYLGIKEYLKNGFSGVGIILETAHPAKFLDIVEPILGKVVEMPEKLRTCMNKNKNSVKMSSDFEELKNFLINTSLSNNNPHR